MNGGGQQKQEREERVIRPEFIIERNGKKAVLYAGLLHMAHEEGLLGITVSVVQCPTDLNGNRAVCTATVHMPDATYTDVGDADEGNVSRMLEPHIIRMAATRAKARALRDALDIGFVAVEELTDIEALGGNDRDGGRPRSGSYSGGGSLSRPPGVVTRGQQRIEEDLGRGHPRGNTTSRPVTAVSNPYGPGGAAGAAGPGPGGPLEAPEWPSVPDGTPGGGSNGSAAGAPFGPTPKQRETLHKFGVRDIPEGMSRKDASELITRKIEEAEARKQAQNQGR